MLLQSLTPTLHLRLHICTRMWLYIYTCVRLRACMWLHACMRRSALDARGAVAEVGDAARVARPVALAHAPCGQRQRFRCPYSAPLFKPLQTLHLLSPLPIPRTQPAPSPPFEHPPTLLRPTLLTTTPPSPLQHSLHLRDAAAAAAAPTTTVPPLPSKAAPLCTAPLRLHAHTRRAWQKPATATRTSAATTSQLTTGLVFC